MHRYISGFPLVLESPWIYKMQIQGFESPWEWRWSLKVREKFLNMICWFWKNVIDWTFHHVTVKSGNFIVFSLDYLHEVEVDCFVNILVNIVVCWDEGKDFVAVSAWLHVDQRCTGMSSVMCIVVIEGPWKGSWESMNSKVTEEGEPLIFGKSVAYVCPLCVKKLELWLWTK